ncbi:hypothetical protein [Allobaculum mucilyticum]|uniref:hypothetical protein n=1 Tax=Allobaculum mucilyticum TaxID=2834459 RepID=UPI001E2A20CB|nr:hypothetical protein [Allobaculum mucilyticum]UNT95186.1 hypothetical protein KWG62_07430 [Allobaculum mucilyticum]
MKRKLIIADPDIDYAIKLLEQFALRYRDTIDIHIITDLDYFYEYFSRDGSADILIVSEDFRSANFDPDQVGQVFWMSENQNVDIPTDPSVEYLYKYSTLSTLMSRLCSGLHNSQSSENNNSRLLVVTSANGGIGKTTIATVLASMQKMLKRRVLYFNAANIQNFSHRFRDQSEIGLSDDPHLTDQASYSPYGTLSRYIRTDGCDYLPAFDCSLSAQEIPMSFFTDFVDKALESGDYDVIVADVSCGDPELQTEFLKRADHAVVITDPSPASECALRKLLPSLEDLKGLEVSTVLNKAVQGGYFDCTLTLTQARNEQKYTFTINQVENIDSMTSSDLARHPAFSKVINLCY